MRNILRYFLKDKSEKIDNGVIRFKSNTPVLFDLHSPDHLSFLKSNGKLDSDSAREIFQEKRSHLPHIYRDPTKIGLLALYPHQGGEGAASLVVEALESTKENAFFHVYNYLYPETEIAVFSTNAELLFEGELVKILDRLISGEFRNCLIGLKMEKHGYGGSPIK